MASLNDSAPPPPRPFSENSASSVRRSLRTSDLSTLRISPSWTGWAVWAIGIGSPSLSRTGALGVPGDRSTKKLPSSRILGRIFISASVWIGRPASSISIVSRAAPVLLSMVSTFLTLPTSTPAMRTGDEGLMLLASLNTASSW